MADARGRLPHEIWTILALGCAVGSGMSVLVVGELQVGVPSCVVCTWSGHTEFCNGNDLTYCNGGLPVLWAILVGLTVGAIGFGICAARASGRDRKGEAGVAKAERAILTPIRLRAIGLAVTFDGVAIASLGLWMANPPVQVCSLPCGSPPYALTGIPLTLTVLGAILLVPGVLLLLMSLTRHAGSPTTRARLSRSA